MTRHPVEISHIFISAVMKLQNFKNLPLLQRFKARYFPNPVLQPVMIAVLPSKRELLVYLGAKNVVMLKAG